MVCFGSPTEETTLPPNATNAFLNLFDIKIYSKNIKNDLVRTLTFFIFIIYAF
jgi:hypothetical protein